MPPVRRFRADLPNSAAEDAADTLSPHGTPRYPLKWFWLAAALLVLIGLVLGALAQWQYRRPS